MKFRWVGTAFVLFLPSRAFGPPIDPPPPPASSSFDSNPPFLLRPLPAPSNLSRGFTLKGIKAALPRPGHASTEALDKFEVLSRTYRLALPRDADVYAAAERLRADPAVEVAEPNYYMKLVATPNDTAYSSQWHHHNTGQLGSQDGYDPATGTAGADIDTQLAWDETTGSDSTVVAIIDSGLDTTHPDISGNLWTNTSEVANGLDDDANGIVDDIHGANMVTNTGDVSDNCGFEQGHGTHVAGIIGASGNNGVGVAGVNWDTSLMSIKVAQNGTCGITTLDITEGITYAMNKGADVINMSLGGPDSVTMHAAADAAQAAGVVLVAAAGNDGTSTPLYPAAYSSVIGVAATDRRDGLAAFSNFGSWVSLAAPGVAIRSTLPVADGTYGYLSGTSMASPVIAGVAALVRTRYPAMTPLEVEERLLDSCETIAATGVGPGRINVARALLGVTAVTPATINAGTPATVTITGASFHSGVTFRLVKSGSPNVLGTGLTINSHSQATVNFDVPFGDTGLYHVEALVGDLVVRLSDALTVEGLSVSGITPSVFPNTAPTGSVAIVGHNFTPSVTFSLHKSGQSDIPGSGVVINSATSADANFNVNGAQGGRWDLVVTSASFSYTLARAVAVTSNLYLVFNPALSSSSQLVVPVSQGNITLDWPANATASAISVDVDAAPTLPAVSSARDPYVATGIGVDLEQVGFTPTFGKPYQLTLPFQAASLPDPSKPNALTIGYFNTTTNRWEPIKNVSVNVGAGTVTGFANHFSHFQILQHVPSTNLDRVVAYPSPFRPDRGHDRIVFDFLAAGSAVKVFDLSGALVRELSDDDGDGRIDWVGVANRDGDPVASGIYFFVVSGGGGSKTGRLAVVR